MIAAPSYSPAMEEWWRGFFDEAYLRLWGASKVAAGKARQVEGLWQVLGLTAGARLLDAPCGYGRIAAPLAERGAIVVGVDQSADLIAEAERGRGELGQERLRYLRADLRQPLAETGFDAAINIFTSLGYGTEDDDVAILTTLRRAVRPGGRVFVEACTATPRWPAWCWADRHRRGCRTARS